MCEYARGPTLIIFDATYVTLYFGPSPCLKNKPEKIVKIINTRKGEGLGTRLVHTACVLVLFAERISVRHLITQCGLKSQLEFLCMYVRHALGMQLF